MVRVENKHMAQVITSRIWEVTDEFNKPWNWHLMFWPKERAVNNQRKGFVLDLLQCLEVTMNTSFKSEWERVP
jgi:hypothetical protein